MLEARQHQPDFPFHSHPTYNITLVVEQVFSTEVAGRNIQSPAGAIVITHPGEVHATRCDSVRGNSFYTFYVQPGLLEKYSPFKPVFFASHVLYDAGLFAGLMQVARMVDRKTPGFENRFIQCIGELTRSYGGPMQEERSVSHIFRRYIERGDMQKFSLEKAAGDFGLDKFKFLRLFKQETGLTPNNYFILRRIEKSKILLLQNADLLGVALETGFYDLAHFSRHFKRITGVTPLAYRNG